jgi:hypothetical protein
MQKMLNQQYIFQAMIRTNVYEIMESSPCFTKGFGLHLSEFDNLSLMVHEMR